MNLPENRRLPVTWSPTFNGLIRRAFHEKDPGLLAVGRRMEVWVKEAVSDYENGGKLAEKACANRDFEMLRYLLEYIKFSVENGVQDIERHHPARFKSLNQGVAKLVADGWIARLEAVLSEQKSGEGIEE